VTLPYRVLQGDCLDVLPSLPAAFARLVYLDPPFNTGRRQRRRTTVATPSDSPAATEGFGGRAYLRRTAAHGPGYGDRFDDYLAFLMPRIEACLRCATDDATLVVHLDAREVHYVKVALDGLLGRGSFLNEIVWAYDFGARSRRRWSAKHDTLLVYVRDPKRYVFDFEAMDRIPYMAPRLVSEEKAARGKTPTDVWWHTIVSPTGKEKTGYPTQKPLGVLRRLIRVHSAPGDVVLDAFAGSGTTGEAAAREGRGFLLVDRDDAAIDVMGRRLSPWLR
jgi:site-specific DNA-methyltransferase (adenine-specific)